MGGGLDRFKAKFKKKKGAYTFHSEKFTNVNAKLHFCSLTSVVSIGDIYLPKKTAWIVQKRADSPPALQIFQYLRWDVGFKPIRPERNVKVNKCG